MTLSFKKILSYLLIVGTSLTIAFLARNSEACPRTVEGGTAFVVSCNAFDQPVFIQKDVEWYNGNPVGRGACYRYKFFGGYWMMDETALKGVINDEAHCLVFDDWSRVIYFEGPATVYLNQPIEITNDNFNGVNTIELKSSEISSSLLNQPLRFVAVNEHVSTAIKIDEEVIHSRKVVIKDIKFSGFGTGLEIYSGDVSVDHCKFQDNRRAIYIDDSKGQITNSEFIDNSSAVVFPKNYKVFTNKYLRNVANLTVVNGLSSNIQIVDGFELLAYYGVDNRRFVEFKTGNGSAIDQVKVEINEVPKNEGPKSRYPITPIPNLSPISPERDCELLENTDEERYYRCSFPAYIFDGILDVTAILYVPGVGVSDFAYAQTLQGEEVEDSVEGPGENPEDTIVEEPVVEEPQTDDDVVPDEDVNGPDDSPPSLVPENGASAWSDLAGTIDASNQVNENRVDASNIRDVSGFVDSRVSGFQGVYVEVEDEEEELPWHPAPTPVPEPSPGPELVPQPQPTPESEPESEVGIVVPADVNRIENAVQEVRESEEDESEASEPGIYSSPDQENSEILEDTTTNIQAIAGSEDSNIESIELLEEGVEVSDIINTEPSSYAHQGGPGGGAGCSLTGSNSSSTGPIVLIFLSCLFGGVYLLFRKKLS